MGTVRWWTRRSTEVEWLDSPVDWSEQLEENFTEMAWTNRWFGGLGSLRRFLRPQLGNGRVRILDVGTGTGDTYRELGLWARKHSVEWQQVALDLCPAFLALAGRKQQGLLRCAGNALALPFAPDTFDAVISLQTLHHLDDAQAVAAIREMVRVSRGQVVISDLRRGLMTYLAAKGLAGAVWRSPLTRHDGPVSVQRSFTAKELQRLGEEAGAGGCRVHRHGPFRLVLQWSAP